MNIFTHPTTIKIAKGFGTFLITVVAPAALSKYETHMRKKEMIEIAKKVVAESHKSS